MAATSEGLRHDAISSVRHIEGHGGHELVVGEEVGDAVAADEHPITDRQAPRRHHELDRLILTKRFRDDVAIRIRPRILRSDRPGVK